MMENFIMNTDQEKYIKQLSPEQKLKASQQLYFSARSLKIASFKKKYPNLSKKEIEKKVTEIFLYART